MIRNALLTPPTFSIYFSPSSNSLHIWQEKGGVSAAERTRLIAANICLRHFIDTARVRGKPATSTAACGDAGSDFEESAQKDLELSAGAAPARGTMDHVGLGSLREAAPNASTLSAFRGGGIQGVSRSSFLERSHQKTLFHCETRKVSGETGSSGSWRGKVLIAKGFIAQPGLVLSGHQAAHRPLLPYFFPYFPWNPVSSSLYKT